MVEIEFEPHSILYFFLFNYRSKFLIYNKRYLFFRFFLILFCFRTSNYVSKGSRKKNSRPGPGLCPPPPSPLLAWPLVEELLFCGFPNTISYSQHFFLKKWNIQKIRNIALHYHNKIYFWYFFQSLSRTSH